MMELAIMTELATLADDIRALSKQTRESVIAIGEKLLEAKKILGHGNFLPWIKAEFGWAERTAQNFIAVAEAADKSANFADLNLPISAFYLLAAPSTPDEAIEAVTKRVEGGEKLSIDDVKTEIRKAKPKVKPNDVEAVARAHKAETGEWPSRGILAKKAGVYPRTADNALRAVKAFEEGQNSTKKMVSIHVLVEKLDPLFEEASIMWKRYDSGLLDTYGIHLKNTLGGIANRGRQLLNEWANGDETVRLTPGLKKDRRRRERARAF